MSSKSRTKSTSFDLMRTTSPVNVHVKKPKKTSNGGPYSILNKSKQKKGIVKKSAKKKVPFIPPPGKTSPIRWESKSHRLEVLNPPLSSTRSRTMVVDELSTTEDEEYHESNQRYERKIDALLNDVSLNEREYVKSKTEDHLNASRRLLEDQENELHIYKKDLNNSIRGYSKLRRSLDVKNKEIELTKNEAALLGNEKVDLMQKLVEVENEGREASRELNKLQDTCHRLKKDQHFSEKDINTLSSQRDMLMDKLDEFELTNKNLRRLLKDSQQQQTADDRLSDRCNILMRKLTAAEAKIQDQSAQLVDQDKQIDTLVAQVESEKHQSKIFDDLQSTMETTRAHLQNQLRQKEGETNRLSTIVSKIEHDSEAQKIEMEHYRGLLSATREKSVRDKEALKKATRIQRERAQKQEDGNDTLQKQISVLLAELDNSKITLQELTDAHTKLKQENEFVQEESKILRRDILDIGDTLGLSSKTMKVGPVHVVQKLVSKVRHLKSVKVENENLKDELKTLEDNLHSNDKEFSFKLRSSDTEVSKLRTALAQFESLANDYKSQLERYRTECDDLNDKLRKQDNEMNIRIQDSMHEVKDVRSSLQSKILDLEPYPELLKKSEVRLQEAQERANGAEKRLTEHTHILAEVTQKIELQTEQLDHIRDKYRSKHEECKHLDQQLQTMERQMQSVDGSQRELIQSLGRKDENLSLLQEKFDCQRVDNERLIHQLEVALSDAKKQADSQKEKSLAKERSAQARIMDLEAQLSRSTQNTQLLKRSKEEAERKFNSRLQDMRDRLEQANTTTRSMQSYVQFLKSTYANVFSDDIEAEVNKY